MTGHPPTSLCAECQGKCCRTYPGSCFPEDFASYEELLEALKSGRYALDWWEGDPRPGKDELGRAYFVRPAAVGSIEIFDPIWHGECIMLSPTGCILPFEQRPSGCRLLIPDGSIDSLKCHYDSKSARDMKQHSAILWLESEMTDRVVTELMANC